MATLTYEDAEEIYEVRGMLETHACVAFCQRASKAQMNSLKVIFAAIETACRQGDIESVLLHSAEYYQVIKEGCGNRILRKMLSQIHNRTNILRRLSLSQPGRMADTLAELQELTDAINARDESAAGKASTHHVRQAGRIALRAMRDRLKIT
ncbi:GntR family transcriptional regulator [Pandoraea cepalis]|uniref:GntR family transcriptional regulator n=1 Tax=Pandoraea cepalis TaxID=2508294 RepID=UPI0020C52CE7|nr:FCD domain-containing protein [Pandoraea cepalis]